MKTPELEAMYFVRNTDTGDTVRVSRTATGESVYSLNGSGYLPVPAKFGQATVKLIAYQILTDHQQQCRPCDAEELTLP